MATRYQVSAVNAENTLVLPAQADKIQWIHFSYSDNPTGGKLTVKSGETQIYEVDITTGGPGPLNFEPGLEARDGATMTIVMAAGGAGIVSKINVRYV